MQTRVPADAKLDALAGVVDRLEHDFGGWRVAWGEVNRVQRLTSDLAQEIEVENVGGDLLRTHARILARRCE